MQAFLASAKIQGAFQPLPSPPLQLTQLDQCRIRDRSTIMARHLFADRGDAFADEQVQPLSTSPRPVPDCCACSNLDAVRHPAGLPVMERMTGRVNEIQVAERAATVASCFSS